MVTPAPLAVPVEQAAAELHCSRATVFRLLSDGTLRRIRIGRKTLVGTESITALLAPTLAEPRRARRSASGFKPFTRADLRAVR